MTDLIAELNQALYLATPAERRAFMSALLPTISRWLADAVESCVESDDADERQWPDLVMSQLIDPVSTTIQRAHRVEPPASTGGVVLTSPDEKRGTEQGFR
ncbi:hypothetical protein [Jiangella gansuensis]|uniref:hypothetical protein n=1 Tax=Jiangella gansuensis TaxID=281473 RepID=UPI000478A5B0|nr:hypothetical protein [Jiangella gansuensis]